MHPRIRHFVAGEEKPISHFLARHFALEDDKIASLLSLGAIYSDHKRVHEDRVLPKGGYLRIHLEPKRFPVAEVDWSKVKVAEEKEFLVVNKPAGIPVHATVDNALENVCEKMKEVIKAELFVTQRLDVASSGLLVFAKTTEFQRRFNQWLVDRKIKKYYAALVDGKPTVGRLVHFMEPGERSPKRVCAEEKPGWQRCELDVLKVATTDGEALDVDIDLLTEGHIKFGFR